MFDKIFVIGLGGTGGQLAEPLARTITNHSKTSNSTIYFFDGDKFEDGNKKRQKMLPEDLEQNKALSTQQQCESMGHKNIIPIDDYVSRATLIPYLRESNSPLVIATVDNDPSRAEIISAIEFTCSDKDFLFLTPGNSDGSGDIKGQVMWFGRIGGQTYGMNPKEYDPDIANPVGEVPRQGSCIQMQTTMTQLIAANLLAAASTLAVIQSALDGTLNPSRGQFHFNGTTLQTTIS
jgi:hypothetical protein